MHNVDSAYIIGHSQCSRCAHFLDRGCALLTYALSLSHTHTHTHTFLKAVAVCRQGAELASEWNFQLSNDVHSHVASCLFLFNIKLK